MGIVIHLLPNAHLDPVWLWDWREGLNEGITTVRTVLDLMEEFPELTFNRGESVIYQHIQKSDPKTFRRMMKRISEGRWDVIGGTAIQPDTNLASTETLCREFELGLEYFQSVVGVRPRIAWQADSFGHSAGLPNIFSAFGMEGFCFTRPQRQDFPMSATSFWWQGDHGNKILCYRPHWFWYGTERENIMEALNNAHQSALKENLVNVGHPVGLGNHGGGPTRRHLLEIEKWKQEHPEVTVRYATFHEFFDLLKKEVTAKPAAVTTLKGEFGFCLRGCYSSVQKFKTLFRQGEVAITDAEVSRSIVGAVTGKSWGDLQSSWASLAFNAFHDILPGTSIERAFKDQFAWMGSAVHHAEEVKFAALNELTSRIDTSLAKPRRPDAPTDVPIVIWNSQPRPFSGLVEMEACLDYRPIWAFQNKRNELPLVVNGPDGKRSPFQEIETEHTTMDDVPWRKRVLVPLDIPALGWTTVTLGYRDEPQENLVVGSCKAQHGESPAISNATWRISAGAKGLQVKRHGRNFFKGTRQLEIVVVEDPWGSWGGTAKEKDATQPGTVRETWSMTQWHVLESGPLRAKLWTLWRGANSWVSLTFNLEDGSEIILVDGRMLWNDRSARVMLVLPSSGPVRYDVPGSIIVRQEKGQVPVASWAARGGIGFASDSFASFNATDNELCVDLARASRYANSDSIGPKEKPWQPATDCGELKFKFCFFADGIFPDRIADLLQYPPTPVIGQGVKGEWKKRGSLGELSPSHLRLLTLEQTKPDQLKIRIQNRSDRASTAKFTIDGCRVDLGRLGPQQIKTLFLRRERKGRWKVPGPRS